MCLQVCVYWIAILIIYLVSIKDGKNLLSCFRTFITTWKKFTLFFEALCFEAAKKESSKNYNTSEQQFDIQDYVLLHYVCVEFLIKENWKRDRAFLYWFFWKPITTEHSLPLPVLQKWKRIVQQVWLTIPKNIFLNVCDK